MNSPSGPQAPTPEPSPQAGLEPAEGLSMVWHSRFGAMRIEVIHGQPHVNGERIEPLPRPTVPQEAP
ncbi:hypothetical protein [Inhella sp.]|uniref:hypothetical protein n=1 Tax=Inhella sp. TaxID=1921806 RepID=UPI0035B1C916